MRVCEICTSDHKVIAFPLGGVCPSSYHRSRYAYLCRECMLSLQRLIESGKLKHRTGPKDTTNSRFAITKAAVKRERFGNANIPRKEIKQQFYGKEEI